ncbi:MAG TPA: carboxypeptidase-like regulatory domain-containing protein [Terriglobales bacterium]|nr:carboxypeptidase-like regulatory domain-containing protein [Terriglobales bacterium]
MSSIHNNKPTKADGQLGGFPKVTHVLLLTFLAAGLLLVVPASAQSTEAANTRTGSALGTVVDISDDPVPDATVVLQGPAGDRLTVVTKDDGSFAFHDVTAGIAYQVTVTAEGFAEWSSSVTVEPEQEKTITGVKLRILAVQRAVTVSYSENEVAAQELRAEEQQRIFRFIPNMYVTYEPHPEPLTTKMKFELAYKSLTSPVLFARAAGWAGVQQAADTPDYRQGAKGYGKRLGADLAGGTTEGLFGNAILPSLLHQDPRYFYQGSGTKKSRALHAILAPFICKGDNGAWQPNYSQWGGSLISSSISMAYYPQSNRNAGHVFGSFGVGMALHVAGSLAQEFILGKVTSKGNY